MLKNNTISCNNETFIDSSYNGISLLRHEEDGYINASRLCRERGKEFTKFIRLKEWNEIIAIFDKTPSRHIWQAPIYQLSSEYTVETRGYYIHPKLTNFVAYWCDIEYAFKVAEIMDLIDEEGKQKNQSIDDKISEMQKENEELKQINSELTVENSNLRSRAVPDHYQYKFTYLIYHSPKDDTDWQYGVLAALVA
jgi:FtsZ-binding cell division protein ZapB